MLGEASSSGAGTISSAAGACPLPAGPGSSTSSISPPPELELGGAICSPEIELDELLEIQRRNDPREEKGVGLSQVGSRYVFLSWLSHCVSSTFLRVGQKIVSGGYI
ncbi:hypothetical protein Cni_G28227 [Canna indica]|uniref:Uncharacterized protein n=1 Tax=Canna indica TaxID=4628 RepID=A0AAQ3L2M3_9LILI|nr:hypothetical protein Cni_G28227 [Canna indica]